MGVIYPDNANRAERVKQLAYDISRLQAQIKEDEEDAHNQDVRAHDVLNEISKRAGYSSLDDYVSEAFKLLSEEDRNNYEKIKGKLQGKDDHVDLALKVASGAMAVGVFARVGVSIKMILGNFITQAGWHMIGRGLIRMLGGAIAEGLELIGAGVRALRDAEVAPRALRFIKITGEVLIAVSFIIDGILLIYEAIEGARQKTELQKGILDLCARRLSVKKIQQQIRATRSFTGDVKATVDRVEDLQAEVATGEITQDKANEKIKEKFDKVARALTEEINKITDQGIWNMLEKQDAESHFAWRDEDPSLKEIQDYFKDHPDASATPK